MARLPEESAEMNVWTTLQQSTSLRHLSLLYPPSASRQLNDLTNPLWSITNLTSLTLVDIPTTNPLDRSSCLGSLFRASNNLENLSISSVDPSFALPDICLPRLCRLVFRTNTRNYHPTNLSSSTSLSRFLLDHPTLEDVEWHDCFPAVLDIRALPRLRRVYGIDTWNGVRSILKAPHRPLQRPIECLGQIQLTLQLFEGLSNIQSHTLRKIDIKYFPTIGDISRLAEMFPNLSWLRIPSIDYRYDFAHVTTAPIVLAEWPDILKKFKHLEVFHGVSIFIEPIDCEENLRRARYLYQSCPQLREVDHWDSEPHRNIRIVVTHHDDKDERAFELKEVVIKNPDDRYAWREPFDRL